MLVSNHDAAHVKAGYATADLDINISRQATAAATGDQLVQYSSN